MDAVEETSKGQPIPGHNVPLDEKRPLQKSKKTLADVTAATKRHQNISAGVKGGLVSMSTS